MAKKSKKAVKTNELDGKEFFDALNKIEEEKGISKSYMMEKITQALISAYKRDHEGITDNITIETNEEQGTVKMFIRKEIVEQVDNPYTEISLAETRSAIPHANLGDTVRIEIKPRNFGRIAAQTARQVIIQGMREAEHNMVYDVFSAKEHDMLTGLVTRIDPRNGAISVRLTCDGESINSYLSHSEQIRGEVFQEGSYIKVYVVEVRRSTRGPQVLISRTHPGLIKRLFELQVPEIFDGTVEIRSIAREAGSRSKIAVYSSDENVDPIGACVGPKGSRVNSVVAELGSEKIDIIKYSEDPAAFVAASLSPSEVLSVRPMENTKSCRVMVPDDQLSLAIGKEGQNARLAAKLTGYKIDIKSASSAHEWEEEDALAQAEADQQEETPTEAEVLEEAETLAEAEAPEEGALPEEAEEAVEQDESSLEEATEESPEEPVSPTQEE